MSDSWRLREHSLASPSGAVLATGPPSRPRDYPYDAGGVLVADSRTHRTADYCRSLLEATECAQEVWEAEADTGGGGARGLLGGQAARDNWEGLRNGERTPLGSDTDLIPVRGKDLRRKTGQGKPQAMRTSFQDAVNPTLQNKACPIEESNRG